MECLAIINQKGGVGKTTTTVNLGAALSRRGWRTLLMDLDPQAHLTTHLGLDGEAVGTGTYEVLTKGLDFHAAIHTVAPNLAAVPAQIELASAEVELVSVVGREVLLRDQLFESLRSFDIVLIDCPPSLGILTLNALSAATRVLIPVQPHFLALQGVGQLLKTTSLVSRRINPGLTVMGMIICMYESGTRLSGEVIDDLEGYLASTRDAPVPWREARIMRTRVRRNIRLAECPSYGQTIFDYAPRSNGAQDYLALADELLAMLAEPAASDRPSVAGEAAIRVEAVQPVERTLSSRPRATPLPNDSPGSDASSVAL